MRPQKSGRRRGCVLSSQGQHKLNMARTQFEQQDNGGDRYTYEQLCDRTGLSFNTIVKILKAEVPVDRHSIDTMFNAFGLVLERQDYTIPLPSASPKIAATSTAPSPITAQIDWGEAPDVSSFYGKPQELEHLNQWIAADRCQLVTLLGMGGIGKTTVVTKLAQQLASEFECVIWRSLRNTPTLEVLLTDLVAFLSNQQEAEPTQVKLLQCLKQSRCLVILDNVETVLEAEQVGQFRAGFEAYGELLRLVAEAGHQSCVVLTSREKPAIVATLEGIETTVRSLRLEGSTETAQAILQSKGLVGTAAEKQRLGDRYSNSPLALKIVATSIQTLFDGNINDFLHEDTLIFNGIRRLFDQQFQRLSALEKTLMFWLAINREWTSFAELQTDLVPAISKGKLLESLEALSFRCLIEQQGTRFTQQPVVMEYITEQILGHAADDLAQPTLNFLTTHALLKATAKDYIRETQTRLIVEPLCDRLLQQFQNRAAIVQRIEQHLAQLRQSGHAGYGAGNLLNLLCHLQTDLTDADFSHLTIRQAYLRKTPLHRSNFAHSTHIQSVFAETMTDVVGIAISPDGSLVAMTGGKSGMLFIYELTTGRWLHSIKAHQTWILGVTFTLDGKQLLTGSLDQTIREWDVATGYCLRSRQLDTQVVSLALSPLRSGLPEGAARQLLASTHTNGTIQLWDINSLDCLRILPAHEDTIASIDFHPHQPWLLSGSHDCSFKLWDYTTGDCLATWGDHRQMVWSAQFNPDGTWIASISPDGFAKLWSLETQACLHTFEIDPPQGRALAFSPDGQWLALVSQDTIRLWDMNTARFVRSFPQNSSPFSLCFTPDSQTLISNPAMARVQFWDVASGRRLRTLQGSLLSLEAMALNSQGTQLVSGSEDGSVRGWDADSGECLTVLSAHTAKVSRLVYHPQQPIFASCSYDKTIKLWNEQGQCVRSLIGHESGVCTVVFHPDGSTLISSDSGTTVRFWHTETGYLMETMTLPASAITIFALMFHPQGQRFATGSEDGIVRLWDYASKQLMCQFAGHQTRVWSLAFHPHRQWIASGGHDGKANVWDVESGDCITTLEGLGNVMSVMFSPDGQWLAASGDRTIQVWHLTPMKCLHTFTDHTDVVSSLAFHPVADPEMPYSLISASYDGTIRYWSLESGECVKTLRPDRLYEGMNIAGIQGLSEGQKVVLKQLGAIDWA